MIKIDDLIKQGLNVEQLNLASKIDNEELKKIGLEIYNDYEKDEQSRKDWITKHAEWKKIYNQQDEPVNEPWDGSSRDCVPILTEACNSFQARAYKAFFPTRIFLDALPIGQNITSETENRAERIAKHMSFQLGFLNKNYKRNKNAMFLATALNGSDFTKTFYDPINKQNTVERVRAVDLIVPYNIGPKSIEDLPRKTHVIYKTLNEVKILKQSGYFVDEAESYSIGTENEIEETEMDFQGVRPSDNDGSMKFCKILEMHTLYDLDEDGIQEPYIITIDGQSKKVLRIQIRYEIDESGQPIKGKKPVEYFTHYKFLENPDGFYGYGIGHLAGALNIAVNKMLRQSINAGELANTATGFMDETLDVKGGEIEMQMGKFVKTSGFGDGRIDDKFFQLQFPGPNPAYINLMQGLENYARSLVSVTDAVTGDVEKVYQPVTITTMLEQSLQMPTSVMEQMAVSFQDELEKLYNLNRKYLSQDSYYIEDGKLFNVSKEDYAEDLHIIPIFDPRNITKQQKIAKAQSLYQFAFQNPLMAQNPKSLFEVSKKMLEAMEIEDIKDLLPDPTEAQQPQRIDDQKQENMYFLMPEKDRPLFDVFEDQDHKTHIQIIDELLNGPFSQEIDKAVLPAILDHRKKHVAFLYMQNEIRLQNARSIRNMENEFSYPQSFGGTGEFLQTEGESDGLQGFNGIERIAGSTSSPETLVPNRHGSETGFLDQTLPIPEEYLKYLKENR